MLILLKILTAWTAISAAASFGIASALSRRIRDINFPRDMDGPGDRSNPDDASNRSDAQSFASHRDLVSSLPAPSPMRGEVGASGRANACDDRLSAG